MSLSYDRKLEKFRTRVQQSVALADDEISRLNQYLNVINTEMLDIRDQLNRYKLQYEQEQEEKVGVQIKEKTKHDAELARLITEHHNTVQDLYRNQASKIAMMQDDYENALQQIDSSTTKLMAREQKKLDAEISKLQQQLSKLKVQVSKDSSDEQNEEEDDDDDTKFLLQNREIEEAKIQILEDNLKERQRERLSALNKNKAQLNQALNTLEDYENSHTEKMERYKDKLAEMDEKYHKMIRDLNSKHQKEIKPIQKRIETATSKASGLQEKINKLEDTQTKKMTLMVQTRDSLKSEFNTLARKTITQPDLNETHELANKSMVLKSTLEQADAQLANVREENQALKREIGRLKHVARINQRKMRNALE